jgi:tetratricopeptide (TPR) repeat protein
MTLETFEPVLYLPDDTPYFPANGDTRQWLRLTVRAAALVLIAFLAFLPTLANGFVWHDDQLIGHNFALRSLSGLAAIWSRAEGGNYHPVAWTFLWVQHHVWGGSTAGYHGASILLHACNCVVLWFVLRRLHVPGAWLAAALFAVHPVQVQAVAWASQQPHLLATFFVLVAVWAFLRLSGIQPPLPLELAPGAADEIDDVLPEEPVKRLYTLAMVCAIAAVLTDRIGDVLPFVLLVLLWWKRGRLSRLEWQRLTPFLLIGVLGSVATIYSAVTSNDPSGPGGGFPLISRISAAGEAVWFYAAKIVWPYPLLFVYSRWDIQPGWQIIFAMAILALAAALWMLRKKWGRGPASALAIYIVLLLPGLVSFVGASPPGIFVADHLEYLAGAVALTFLAWGFVALLRRIPSPVTVRSLRAATGIACLVGLGLMTAFQSLSYSDEDRAWTDTLAYDPTSAVPRTQYAMLLLSRRNRDGAAELLRTISPLDENDVALLLARAQLYETQSRYSEAIGCFTQAQRLSPANRQIAIGLAGAYESDGRIEEALRAYGDALTHDPNNEDIHNRMGTLLQKQGRLAEAIEHYQSALRINPRYLPAMTNLANALFAVGAPTQAFDLLKQASDVDPGNYQIYMQAGLMCGYLKDFAQAERLYRAAVTLAPNVAECWNNLGAAQFEQGHLREALWSFDHAVRLRPDFQQAQENLERARRQLSASS